MRKATTIQVRKLIRQAFISSLMVVVATLAFASKGGGGEKKNNNTVPLKNEFVPIRTTNYFTLKSGPSYRGSYVLGEEKTRNYVSVNTLITYEKGNSLYILPYKYKVSSPSIFLNIDPAGKNNLQMLDLRIRMHK